MTAVGRAFWADVRRCGRSFHRARHASGHTWQRLLAQVAAVSLVLATVVVPWVVNAPEASAAAASTIGLNKTGPGSVLAGSPVAYALSATNPSGSANAVQQYNVAFRDVLPPGVSYKPGSTTPADVGDPKVVTAQVHFPNPGSPLIPQQTLIWSNVADLPLDGTVTLNYLVVPDQTLYPVGSTVGNNAQDFASTNPRLVPKFTAAGVPVDSGSTAIGPARSTSTTMSAITITKSDDASPEGKLLRGVHKDHSVYTLLVINNSDHATTNNQVVDYLPANLEYLACGTTDNSGAVEYPGSGPLGVGRIPADSCRQATSVQTVDNPIPGLIGIFTKVTWTVPTLQPDETYTIRYVAAIPLRDNTLTFPGGAPTPASGDQGANLDNNTGASTRQSGGGQVVTNSAAVSGTYTGPTPSDPTGANGTAVSDNDTHTVTAKDVRVLKSVQTVGGAASKQDAFTINGIATYSLEVDTSEYTSAQGIVLTDQLDNGVCPLVSTSQWATLVAANPSLNGVTGCVDDNRGPTIDAGPAISYRSVTFDPASGVFTMTFSPIANLTDQSSVHITYPARMLPRYPGGGTLAGTETSAGDSFTNTVSLAATTTPIGTSPETGQLAVTDTSSAQLVSGGSAIKKLIKPLPVAPATDYSCAGTGYANPTNPALPAGRTTFALGDLVCFELRVTFATGTFTRNAAVTDFLPQGTTFVAATIGPDNTVPTGQILLDASTATAGSISWALGRTSGNARLLDPGQTFVARVAVRVTDPANPGAVDITGNLMKLRQQNSAGKVVSLRDQVNFAIAPAVRLSVTKGVASINGLPSPENVADTDHQQVKQGDVVDFRIDLSHLGAAATGTDRSVSNIGVWDVLPAPFTCADVTASATFGQECRDAGALNEWHPSVTGRSIIRWTIPGSLAAGGSTRLDYTVTVPQVGPAIDVTNTAYVSSYTADSDDQPDGITYYPAGNIDTDVPVASQQAPAVSDSSDVYTSTASATKTITSAITESGNNGASQAAVGETLTFTIGAVVPAGLTVTSATLADTLPANGLELLNAAHPPTAALAPDASDPGTTTALPGGFSLDPSSGVLTFPASYTNATAIDQLFLLTLTGRFTSAVGGQGDTRDDTAAFAYTPVGGTPASVTRSATSTVVAPLPTLSKSVSPAGPYTAGQSITYQLTAGNTAGRPTAYDNWVLDCVPAGLQVTGYVSGGPAVGSAESPIAGTGTGSGENGCATGTTRIGWHVGDLAGGVSASLFYTVSIEATAAAGKTYLNTANLSGASIAGVRTTPQSPLPDGAREYTASDSQSVKVTTPALSKTAGAGSANVGSTVTFTVTAQIPAEVNLYHAVLRDLLPVGLDAATLTTVSLNCTQTPGTCVLPSNAPTTAASGTGTLATWDLGDLLAQPQVRTITLTYTAALADVPSVIRNAVVTNGASIAWNSTSGGGMPPFIPTDISASATVVVTEPVIHLAKSVSNTTPEPGQTFDYTLTANNRNTGESNVGPAFDVTIKDAIPSGVAIDPSTLPGGTSLSGTNANGSGGTLTWSIPGPLAAGGSATITYHATLAPSAVLGTGGQRNTATVTDVYSQMNSGGRHSTPGTTASRTVTPDFPKIVPSKAAVTTGPAYAGTPFTWQLTLTNAGTGRAYHLTGTDVLPLHWTYRAGSARVTTAGGTPVALEPTIGAATPTDGPTLTWTGLAPLQGNPATAGLAPGQTVTITLDATPGPDAPTSTGTASPNTNTLTATGNDATNATGNAAGQYGTGTGSAVALIAAADVQITKTAGTFTAGGQGSWTLTAKNNGPDTAVGPFNLTDTVPTTLTPPGGTAGAPLTLVSATGPGWSCTTDAGSGAVACTRTDGNEVLAAGRPFPAVAVNVIVPPDAISGSTASNSGTITDRTFDPDTTNNTDSASGTVVTEGDLRITKTLNGTLTAGANAGYTIGVTNLGPSVSLANNGSPIIVTDTLPSGTVFVSAAGTGWSCDVPVSGVLTCRWTTTLAASAGTAPLTVTVRIPADRTSAVVNTAAVAPGDTPDNESSGGVDTATVTTTPDLEADLGVSKVLVGKDTQQIVAGTDRIYELSVTNYGPSDAVGVVVTDTLPAFLSSNGTFTSVSGTWNCFTAGQRVTCSLAGAIAGPGVGSPVTDTVRISVHVADNFDTATNIVNSATVSADTPDPGPTSNTTSDDSAVTGQADLTLDKTITTAAVAGRTMIYRLQVHNLGPSVAVGPTIVIDTLPAGLTFDPANLPAGAGWTCTLTGSATVTCSRAATIGTNASGNNLAAPIDAPVLVDEQTVGTVVNRATVSGPVFDPVPENDTVTRDTPIAELADVSITKTAASATVVAGTDVTYAIGVVNAGPGTARGLSVVDTPDPGLVVTGLSGPGWSCTLATLTCLRDELTVAAGTSTITVTAHPVSSAPTGTQLVNAADLTVTTPHSAGPPAWHGEDTVTAHTLAGVSLTKTHDSTGDPVSAGDPVNFTLTASNAGPSDAGGPITITDALPNGMTYLSNQGPWTCTAAGQVITCTLDGSTPSIPAGGAAPALLLSVAIGSGVLSTSLTNNAAVATGTPQNPAVPVTASDDVPVTTTADLTVVKSHTATATAGQNFDWTLTVTNLGPSVSQANVDNPITVTDTLPAGTTFVSGGSTESGFSCVAGTPAATVICTRTTDLAVNLPAGSQSVAFPIRVAVAPSVRGTVTNTASIAAGATREPTGGIAAADNNTSDPADVATRADLSITKTHADGARAVAGAPFNWTITVTDAGPSDSFAAAGSPITVTDTLPAGVTYSGATSPDFTCAAGAVIGTVLCQATAPLTVGDHPITLTGLIDPITLGDADLNDPTVHTLSNTAEITASTTPDLAGTDTATDVAPLDTRADLAIVKSHEPGATAVPGQQFSWSLMVSNLGPSVSRASLANPITVTDTLPTGVTLISATGDGWECTAVGQLLTCTAGTAAAPADLLLGAASPITVTTAVAVEATGSLNNAATVHPGTTSDPDATDPAGNNTSTDEAVPVGPQADLSIVKSHDAAAVRVGNPITFTLTVANKGPSTARNVVVQDTMPVGLAPLSASAAGWTCTVTGQQVNCTLDSPTGLAPLTAQGGAEQQLTVTATVTKHAYPGVTNVATVSSKTPDPLSANNTTDDPVVVPALDDLSITKTLIGSLVVGQQATYRLTVTNDGPTEAPGVVTVTDQLPTGLTAVSARGVSVVGAQAPGVAAQTSCLIAATISCRLPGSLAAGTTAVIDVTVQVGPSAYPNVTNSATVTAAAQDTNPSNDTSTVTTPVTPLVGLGLTKALVGTGPDADGLLSWRLTVTNSGPNASTAPLTVTDHLPQGLAYRDFNGPADWSCRGAGSAVVCTFAGTLEVRATTAVTIRTTVSASAGTSLVNRATLRASTGPTIAVAAATYFVPPLPPVTTPPTTTAATTTTTTTTVSSTTPISTTPVTTPTRPPGRLPNTGVDLAPMLFIATLLLLAGAALCLSGRPGLRRRH
ncbi:putative repeat protein (TIGR01451 family)/fimbrial isopeptide formation D2 family protein [Nakamurella sp. UYEF19]|uniref:isopeptide-forming domain-containing fimbrial protein n=1 Tax=Nakamurella sp. UYEF19 TaxID=1756392 RepID=UPI00339817DB